MKSIISKIASLRKSIETHIQKNRELPTFSYKQWEELVELEEYLSYLEQEYSKKTKRVKK